MTLKSLRKIFSCRLPLLAPLLALLLALQGLGLAQAQALKPVPPLRARVNDVQTQAQAQVVQQRARIDELQKKLEQRLRQLLGGVRLP